MPSNPQSDFVTKFVAQIREMRAVRDRLKPLREQAKLFGWPETLGPEAFDDLNSHLGTADIQAAFDALDAVEIALFGPDKDGAPLRALLKL